MVRWGMWGPSETGSQDDGGMGASALAMRP